MNVDVETEEEKRKNFWIAVLIIIVFSILFFVAASEGKKTKRVDLHYGEDEYESSDQPYDRTGK